MTGFRDHTGQGAAMTICALPAVTVVLQFGGPLHVGQGSGERSFGGVVAGISPGVSRIRAGRVECVELRLSPVAAYPLLGLSPAALGATVAGTHEVWGRAAVSLGEQLAETRTWERRFELTAEFLAAHRTERVVDPEVRLGWQRIVGTGGRISVRELAAETGWSRKRLWSRFTAQVGVTPKRAARVVRFRRAFELLIAGTAASEAAVRCGYADQSHMHREVSAFAGTTPGALGRG